ncbi:hypothetical protein PAXRUDRAFT_232371 [Paxillus rubicundulus Ve08.2h10]|uniref:Uncharacterized protein n=1 Tax=Paxillus rubicundulus Ve08.2h10 TaxID=930991 RepID=A0A0D0DH01_9AGAM|nr:hypothetical protein PAXRUDRAFT_232371 [Paxillus rubicundulus Ve08.2h10]
MVTCVPTSILHRQTTETHKYTWYVRGTAGSVLRSIVCGSKPSCIRALVFTSYITVHHSISTIQQHKDDHHSVGIGLASPHWWPRVTDHRSYAPNVVHYLDCLHGTTLYDILSLDYPLTKVVINGTTVTAECGLLSKTSGKDTRQYLCCRY